MTKLLTKSANILLNNGFKQVASTVDRTGTNTGITHTIFTYDDHEFHVRAKEYIYKNLASFGSEQVEHAISENAMLVMYSDKEQSFTVFCPDYVDKNGSTTHGKSKRSDSREWIELSMKHGVDMRSFLVDGERPDMINGGNARLGQWM